MFLGNSRVLLFKPSSSSAPEGNIHTYNDISWLVPDTINYNGVTYYFNSGNPVTVGGDTSKKYFTIDYGPELQEYDTYGWDIALNTFEYYEEAGWQPITFIEDFTSGTENDNTLIFSTIGITLNRV